MLAIDRQAQLLASDNSLALNELNGAVNALARTSGLATDDAKGPVTVTVVRVGAQPVDVRHVDSATVLRSGDAESRQLVAGIADSEPASQRIPE